MREQQIPPRKRSRPGSDGIKHGIPPPSRSSSGVRTCTQHGTLSWHRRTRSFRNKDSPCSRLREPVALHALCVCVPETAPSLLEVCVGVLQRTDGREEGGKKEKLHLASCIVRLCVRRAGCGFVCRLLLHGLPKGESRVRMGKGRGGGGDLKG